MDGDSNDNEKIEINRTLYRVLIGWAWLSGCAILAYLVWLLAGYITELTTLNEHLGKLG